MDFAALRQRIVDDADRVLFDEAVRCYDAGAHRAAYVFAWINVAEGLLNKFDQMGVAQPQIAGFVTQFKQQQANGSAKDADLLNQAKTVDFVDTTEFKALDALRDMRNQYGHPTAAAPTATAAAAAIELAVDAVLAKPALLLYLGARGLAEQIGHDRHLIPDDPQAVADWTTARAPLVAPSARPIFIRTLVERHAANLGQIDEQLSERCRIAAATAIRMWAPDLAEADWTVDALSQSHGPSAAAVFSSAGAWEHVGDDQRYPLLSRCLDIPQHASDPKLTIRLLARAFELHALGDLTGTEEQLVADRVQVIDGTWLVSAHAPIDLLVAKATAFLNHGSFAENQNGTRILDAIVKDELGTASDDVLASAGAALAGAARRNAYVARNLLGDIVRHAASWPRPLRVAAAIESVTEPWLVHNEYTARQGMRLALQDAAVAAAVRDAVTTHDEDSVPLHGESLVEALKADIAGPDEAALTLDADAVPIVEEILTVVAERYEQLYSED